ncbi:MAG: hypothetical protein QGG53_29950 [Planctomycetota bacterium]|jgi:hypothetical protein|nr:hypothetical protein [Planctomycetota bacterium]
MATQARRTTVRRKKSNLGPVVFAILAMALGGGGSFFIITKHKEQKAAERKSLKEAQAKKAKEKAEYAKDQAERKAKLVAARAERERKKQESEQAKSDAARKKEEMAAVNSVKAALPDLMADAQYERALAMLSDARQDDLADEAKAAIDNLKQEVAQKARDEFIGIKDRATGLADAGDVAGAVKLLKGAEKFGMSDISREASQLIQKIEAEEVPKEPDSVAPRIAAYKMIQSELVAPLKDGDYGRAGVVVGRLAGRAGNKPFKESLESMKGDFAAVSGIWSEFLEKMGASPGKQVQFGIKIGKVVKAGEGQLVIDNKGKKESLTLKEMQPKWIEMHLGLQPDGDDEKWYAIALLNLHRGRTTSALPILRRISDVYPRAQSQLEWLGWKKEVEVKDLIDEVKEASQSGNHSTVLKKVAAIKKSYANTRYYKEQEADVTGIEEKSTSAREQVKGLVGARMDVLEAAHDDAKDDLSGWYETTRNEIEDRKEKALTDPVAYINYGSSSSNYSSSEKTTVGSRSYYGEYGYYVREGQTSKEANLKTINDILNMKQKYRSPYNDAQKKKLENERRRLMKEVRAANNEYATNASKLKNLNRRKRDNLKNVKIRIGRQIKSGDDLSDAEIQKAFE